MIKGFLSLAALVWAISSYGQQQDGKKNIEKLCGCFDVGFKYAETFSPDNNYKFHDRDETSGGRELVMAVESGDNKIVIQHLLVISDSMIIKHWREDWTYENPVLWKYTGNQTWIKTSVPASQAAGKWVQTVWEVSDAPRYQGASEWLTTDNKTSWENTADAPLPRREYSVRHDYNILRRTNRIITSDTGWIHEQDNQKIIRNGKTDQLLVEEKGINTYKRIDNKECAAAKLFWEKNKDYWTKVRKSWDDYLATHALITLQNDLNGKPLYQYLNDQAKEYATGKISPADIDARIRETLEKFIGK